MLILIQDWYGTKTLMLLWIFGYVDIWSHFESPRPTFFLYESRDCEKFALRVKIRDSLISFRGYICHFFLYWNLWCTGLTAHLVSQDSLAKVSMDWSSREQNKFHFASWNQQIGYSCQEHCIEKGSVASKTMQWSIIHVYHECKRGECLPMNHVFDDPALH